MPVLAFRLPTGLGEGQDLKGTAMWASFGSSVSVTERPGNMAGGSGQHGGWIRATWRVGQGNMAGGSGQHGGWIRATWRVDQGNMAGGSGQHGGWIQVGRG